MYPISDENPNNNGSHFTIESLHNSLSSFISKPVVGFFTSQNDFESHKGKWVKDRETGVAYWDVSEGERPLGVIRESDTLEVVEKDGKHWIHLSCVLWTQYGFRQIKRLLKDKHKKVSVEIDVLEYHMDDHGIKHIDKFNLIGITILGSRNGQPVKEGINDAHLSVLANIDENDPIYSKQRAALCFAYQKLDEQNDDRVNIQRKESADLDKQENFDYKILVDKSKDALSDTPWGDVDKTELRHKVVEASNYEEVAGDIFLDLRDGWKDKEVTALKYPVMQLKDNTAVYNREALSTALGYAKQNDETEIIGKIMTIYKDLDIDVEHECDFVKCEDCAEVYGCPCEELGKECAEAGECADKPEEAYAGAEPALDALSAEPAAEGKEEFQASEEHGDDCTCDECMAKKEHAESEHGEDCTCDECMAKKDQPEPAYEQSEEPAKKEPEKDEPEAAYEDHGDEKSSEDGDEEDKDEDDDKDSDSAPESQPEPAYEEIMSANKALMEENMQLKEQLEAITHEKEELATKCADYDKVMAECDQLKMAMFKIECERRVNEAKRLLNGENFSQEGKDKIFKDCEEGKFASYEDLKKEIALQLFNYNHKDEPSKEVFSALPQFESFNTETKTKTKQKQSSRDTLQQYTGKTK